MQSSVVQVKKPIMSLTLFYWSRVYSGSLEKGQDYRELPNVIAVNIVDFDFPVGGGFHTCFRLREDSDSSLILSSAIEIHCINMVKWRRLEGKDVHNNPLHRWLAWFDQNSPPDLIEEVVNMDNAIYEAFEKYEEAKKDQDALRAYWAHRKFEHDQISRINFAHDKGYSEGLEQGREKGMEQSKIEFARKLKARGRPLEEIVEDTGLSMEYIEKL